jgi:hypothetical protein
MEIAEIAASGVSAERLAHAVRHADFELSSDPISEATLLSEGLYKTNVRPLCVYFHVDETRRVVIVDGIRWIEN